MDEILVTLIREVGPVGLIALALLGVSRTLKPAIEGLMSSMNDAAEARREQSKTNEAVLKRWEESDRILDNHSKAFASAMKEVAGEIHDLKITDSQRIKQNDVTIAQVTGTRDDIRKLSADFLKGKNDAVSEVGKAMDDKLTPIQQRLEAIERLLHEVRTLVMQQERPAAEPPAPPALVPKDEPESGAEDKSA